jgi:hypothetical protein
MNSVDLRWGCGERRSVLHLLADVVGRGGVAASSTRQGRHRPSCEGAERALKRSASGCAHRNQFSTAMQSIAPPNMSNAKAEMVSPLGV